MTDRELLELAAKAAGEWPSPEPFEHVLNRWNPLENDGDALRLAVDLGIDVLVTSTGIESGLTVAFPSIDSKTRIEVAHERSPYAATRRAIVRAAAEIGKGMT